MFRVAVCSLNQWALDFEGNYQRIVESIKTSKKQGATIRCGPELEISGYSCEDAFFEQDTVLHSWEVLGKILQDKSLNDILIDTGFPILKDGVLYNCRVLLLNQKIVFIRPKTKLAGNGNYREERWFTPWESKSDSTWFILPENIRRVTGQTAVPFGSDVLVEVNTEEGDRLRMGFEICEELWRLDATHINLLLERGVHLICNASASYWEIRKLEVITRMIKTTTMKFGGAYAYTNLIGCDGSRICFYGKSTIAVNGKLLARTSTLEEEFFDEVQVSVADIDVRDIEAYRMQGYMRATPWIAIGDSLVFDSNEGFEAKHESEMSVLKHLTIHVKAIPSCRTCSDCIPPPVLPPEDVGEEVMRYTALWLWDYLRRVPVMKGFMLPLSGGLDSSSVACIIYGMCRLLRIYIRHRAGNITPRIQQLTGTKDDKTISALSTEQITKRLLRCAYLKTKYSGKDTEERARLLSELIGAEFISINFNDVYESILKNSLTPIDPKVVSLKEQNLQARLRMVHTYFLADDRLVLSTGNVDEALVGYLTKYDCSSADINPIGAISKADLRVFLDYIQRRFFPPKSVVTRILEAIPSAELTGAEQKDEEDLGLTYDELSFFGRYRRGIFGCYGPYLVFCQMYEQRGTFPDKLEALQDPVVLARKVKRFFSLHARNRHKQTILTPSLHSETYSPDDNRFDHRQFLFDSNWTWQFRRIDEKLAEIRQQSRREPK